MVGDRGGLRSKPFSISEIEAEQDPITKEWMLWSNEALAFENKWYKGIKGVLRILEKEVADKFLELKVDEKGVLMEIPSTDILFDRNEAIKRMAEVGSGLIKETLQYFGDRAIKEVNAHTSNE